MERKKLRNYKRRKQALCISSVASNLDNFNRSNIDILINLGYEVTLASNFHSGEDSNSQEKTDAFAKEMREKGVYIVQVDFARSMKKAGMQIKSIWQVRKLLKRGYDLIHCHSPICAAIVRTVAEPYRKKKGTKVLYTAHGFHFFTGAPLINWLLFYPVEKWLSRYTDVLITINKEDYERAKRKFHATKVAYIPGVGVDTEKFRRGNLDKEVKRKSLGMKFDDIMLLSVDELSARKKYMKVIEALGRLNSRKIHYFIAGIGKLDRGYREFAEELGIGENMHFLDNRTDISELCQAADLFIIPSVQEGFSLALMEAVACKTPVICSRSYSNLDLVEGKEWIFDPQEVNSLMKCLKEKVSNGREALKECATEAVENNYSRLLQYDFRSVKKQIYAFYQQKKEGMECRGWKPKQIDYLITRQEFKDIYGIEEKDLFLLSVGELNKNKNHELAIRALAKLKSDGEDLRHIQYFICGTGKLKNNMERLIENLGLEDNVHLLGYREDMPEIYGLADIFLFTSKREGLPVALMEAMAAGLPSIVTKARGNIDLIQNNVHGFIIDYDKNDLAKKLYELKKNEGLRNMMGNNSGKRIMRFDISNVRGKMEKIYADLEGKNITYLKSR